MRTQHARFRDLKLWPPRLRDLIVFLEEEDGFKLTHKEMKALSNEDKEELYSMLTDYHTIRRIT